MKKILGYLLPCVVIGIAFTFISESFFKDTEKEAINHALAMCKSETRLLASDPMSVKFRDVTVNGDTEVGIGIGMEWSAKNDKGRFLNYESYCIVKSDKISDFYFGNAKII